MLLISSCNPHFEPKESHPIEQVVSRGLENFAMASLECQSEKLDLVRQKKPVLQNLVTQLKNLNEKSPAGLNIKALRHYTNLSEGDQLDLIYQIITSQGFKTVVTQTGDFIKAMASNEIVLSNLEAIRDDFNQESGDRTAKLLTDLATNTTQQNILLATARSALCDNPSESDLLGAIFSPETLWKLGPNGVYLLNSDLKKHAVPLVKAVQTVPIPEELGQFIGLMKEMMPSQDICNITTVEPYQKYFSFVANLIKVPDNSEDSRPLRTFLNVLFKLYSMEKSNQCSGSSFDDLKKEHFQNMLFKTAHFLADDTHGVVGFLRQIKPRH